eukprot:3527144-Pleurochrysis_carterae.AAC.1
MKAIWHAILHRVAHADHATARDHLHEARLLTSFVKQLQPAQPRCIARIAPSDLKTDETASVTARSPWYGAGRVEVEQR